MEWEFGFKGTFEGMASRRLSSNDTPYSAQAIPRRIWQIGATLKAALYSHGNLMQTWWKLNPEYEYKFLSDPEASALIVTHASADEQQAYRALINGAQRADLFRVLVLKYLGGVYADLDSELRAPLRTIITSNASCVTGPFWTSEMLAYEPGHSILNEAAAIMTRNVLHQVELQSRNDSKRCHAPASCVLFVTGPYVYRRAVAAVAERSGCGRYFHLPKRSEQTQKCSDKHMQRTYICHADRGSIYNSWVCNISKHWDCRGNSCDASGCKRRECSKAHYTNAANFFHVSKSDGAVPLKCQNAFARLKECLD
mmetsp:Transcript_43068/g.71597  ORF Transcript_43068/g.71597 Transcript_43068/m.71597 type:complete len:311 (+) Transcript_43068:25-957(+)